MDYTHLGLASHPTSMLFSLDTGSPSISRGDAVWMLTKGLKPTNPLLETECSAKKLKLVLEGVKFIKMECCIIIYHCQTYISVLCHLHSTFRKIQNNLLFLNVEIPSLYLHSHRSQGREFQFHTSLRLRKKRYCHIFFWLENFNFAFFMKGLILFSSKYHLKSYSYS